MAYEFYMNGVMLPVTPSKMTLKVNGKNKTMNLINDGEINILKNPGLSDISFSCMLPQSKYPFAKYNGGFKKAAYFLDWFESLKTSKKPFIFIVIRNKPNGEPLFDTNIKVALEDYQIVDDVEKYGFDIGVEIKLKQYKNYGTKEIELYEQTQQNGSTVMMGVMVQRRDSDKSIVKKYTVQPGDALWTIARAVYGDGEKYVDIYEANKSLIDSANRGNAETKYWIHPGQVLTIPSGG